MSIVLFVLALMLAYIGTMALMGAHGIIHYPKDGPLLRKTKDNPVAGAIGKGIATYIMCFVASVLLVSCYLLAKSSLGF